MIAQGVCSWSPARGDRGRLCFRGLLSGGLAVAGAGEPAARSPSTPALSTGWGNAHGLPCSLVPDAEPTRFALGQRDWHCLCSQPDVRRHRRRFCPWNGTAAKGFCAESRRGERYLVTQRTRSRGNSRALGLSCRASWRRSQWKATLRQSARGESSDEGVEALTLVFCPEFSSV